LYICHHDNEKKIKHDGIDNSVTDPDFIRGGTGTRQCNLHINIILKAARVAAEKSQACGSDTGDVHQTGITGADFANS
jgi:hypothetical protein